MCAQAFTSGYNGLSRVLKNYIQISAHNNSPLPAKQKSYIALWDTGATCSCISRTVVEDLQLMPVSMCEAHTANGTHSAPLYYVDLYLPSGAKYPKLLVMEAILFETDILVGMDVIGSGDFAVSNCDGKTVFSFRYPSKECIDFVKEQKGEPRVLRPVDGGQAKNSKCACGSGKKYKACCGRGKVFQ